MTREELVLQRLNTLEKRLHKALENNDEVKVNLVVAEIGGYIDAIVDLGYKPIRNDDEAYMYNGYWIYTYTAIEDVR